MLILITGIGIVGKSTLRRQKKALFETLDAYKDKVEHYDADKFREIRHPLDQDLLSKLPYIFPSDKVFIIEDIHATKNNAILPLGKYDMITYIRVSTFAQILFWLPRIKRWWARGQYSWEAETNRFKGNGRPYSLANIPGIMKELFRDIRNRRKWIKEDLRKLRAWEKSKGNKVEILKASWTWSGPVYMSVLELD